MAETRVFFQKDARIVATVAPNLCFCNDTNDWRANVLLATQGGRKTTASRIGKKDGRLWNLPFPEGMELARFAAEDELALWGVPVGETDLGKCPRLQAYRKCLMPKTRGITFDLTKGKDLICALPYREYGMDVDWIFVMCFRDEKKRLHWFTTEESLRLCKNDAPPAPRPVKAANVNANEAKASRSSVSSRSSRTSRSKAASVATSKAKAKVEATPPPPEAAANNTANLFAPSAIQPGCVVYHAQDPTQTVGEVMHVAADGMALIHSQGKQYTVPTSALVLVHAPVAHNAAGFGGLGMAGPHHVARQQPQQQVQEPHFQPLSGFPYDAAALLDEAHLDTAMDDEEMIDFPLETLPTFVDAILPSDAILHEQPYQQQQQQQPVQYHHHQQQQQQYHHQQQPFQHHEADLLDASLLPAAPQHHELDWNALTQGLDANLEANLDVNLDSLMADSYMSSLGELDVQYS